MKPLKPHEISFPTRAALWKLQGSWKRVHGPEPRASKWGAGGQGASLSAAANAVCCGQRDRCPSRALGVAFRRGTQIHSSWHRVVGLVFRAVPRGVLKGWEQVDCQRKGSRQGAAG